MRQSEKSSHALTRAAFRRERGVVFIEGLLALSVLFIVLLSLRFLQRAHKEAFHERARQRVCVWHLAEKGCPQETPAGCEAGALEERSLSDDEEQAISDAQATGSESLDARISEQTRGLKRRILIEKESHFRRHSLLGGQLYRWKTRFSLPCNPSPQHVNLSPEGAFRDFQ